MELLESNFLRQLQRPFVYKSNTGQSTIYQEGQARGINVPMKFDPNAIANVVGVAPLVAGGFHVELDLKKENAFVVTNPETGWTSKFWEHDRLYLFGVLSPRYLREDNEVETNGTGIVLELTDVTAAGYFNDAVGNLNFNNSQLFGYCRLQMVTRNIEGFTKR